MVLIQACRHPPPPPSHKPDRPPPLLFLSGLWLVVVSVYIDAASVPTASTAAALHPYQPHLSTSFLPICVHSFTQLYNSTTQCHT